MKKIIILVLIVTMLSGCSKNNINIKKETYLKYVEELEKANTYTDIKDINFDLNISVDKINEEEISYRAIIDNPKENMYNIKALVIHDNFTDEIFPSIGILDEKLNLIVGNKEIKGISLVGYIKTDKQISELDIDIKVYIEYTNESNEKVKIYYKTTI